jgi:hypothetical protein
MPLDFGALGQAVTFEPGLVFTSESESQAKISARKMRADLRHKAIDATKKQKLAELVPDLPAKGECYHVVSNGDFDDWTWVPVLAG